MELALLLIFPQFNIAKPGVGLPLTSSMSRVYSPKQLTFI